VSDQALNPELDAIWAKHDRLSAPELATELLEFGKRTEQERNVWKHSAGTNAAEVEALQQTALDWFLAFQGLKTAVADTLEENRHLADGDNCTLKKLKDAYRKALHAKAASPP
jgi:hypothetical protein